VRVSTHSFATRKLFIGLCVKTQILVKAPRSGAFTRIWVLTQSPINNLRVAKLCVETRTAFYWYIQLHSFHQIYSRMKKITSI